MFIKDFRGLVKNSPRRFSGFPAGAPDRECRGRGRAGRPIWLVACTGVLAGFSGIWWPIGFSWAMHEADHRFAVEGYVCGPDGEPVSQAQVIVKDTRASVGASAYTDGSGYYKAVLHLHDENRGDPIVVSVGSDEKRITAEFDPNDKESERHSTVTFGSGCDVAAAQTSAWLLYGAGAGVVAILVLIGARVASRRRPASKRGKKGRK